MTFRITDGKGFSMSLPNGYAVSVQWGYGNYCDNYNAYREHGEDYRAYMRRLGETGSATAECAVINSQGSLIELPEQFSRNADTVTNRSDAAEVLALMNWAASLPQEQS